MTKGIFLLAEMVGFEPTDPAKGLLDFEFSGLFGFTRKIIV